MQGSFRSHGGLSYVHPRMRCILMNCNKATFSISPYLCVDQLTRLWLLIISLMARWVTKWFWKTSFVYRAESSVYYTAHSFKYSRYRILWLSPCDTYIGPWHCFANRKFSQKWHFITVGSPCDKVSPFVTIFWPGPKVVTIPDTCCSHSSTLLFPSRQLWMWKWNILIMYLV